MLTSSARLFSVLSAAPALAAPGLACAPLDLEALPCQSAENRIAFSEIMVDPPGKDGGQEWIELYNGSSDLAVDLTGAVLSYSRSSSEGTPRRHRIHDLEVAPASYVVLGSHPSSEEYPHFIHYSYGNALGELGNTGGQLELLCGATVLDAMSYTDPTPATARAVDGASPPTPGTNDDPAGWCDGRAPLSENSWGTPGAPNDVCIPPAVGSCEATALQPGDVLISEVMPNPTQVADRDGEWVELRIQREVVLDQLQFGHDEDGVAVIDHTVTFDTCPRVPGTSFILLAAHEDPDVNGGLPPVLSTVPWKLANGPGPVSLFVGAHGQVLDRVTWTGSPAGTSLQRDLAQTPPDSTAFCPAQEPYGAGDLGTPGEPHLPCPSVADAGLCQDEDGTWRTVDPAQAGDLVVNELMIDPAATPDAAGEWIELVATRATDLQGLRVVRDTTTLLPFEGPSCASVSAQQIVVLARTEALSTQGFPEDATSLALTLPNTGGTLALQRGETWIDRVTWTNAPAGASLSLDPDFRDAELNDDPQVWCPSTTTLETGDRGTPGLPNPPCDRRDMPDDPPPPLDEGGDPPEQCTDSQGLRPRQRPTPQSLVIAEIMPDPAVVRDDQGEWFEVFAHEPFDLYGLTIGRGEQRHPLVDGDDCVPMHAGDRAVFVRSSDPLLNGGISEGYPLGASLVQSGGSLAILDGEVLLDRVTWEDSASGRSWSLDSSALDALANDDPSAWCPASVSYGAGDYGTPAAANPSCGASDSDPPADMCREGEELRPLAIPQPGDVWIAEWMASPHAVADRVGEWFEVEVHAGFDLNALRWGRDLESLSTPFTAEAPCLPVTPGQRLVVARSSDPAENGHLPEVAATFSFSLVAQDGSILLASDSGTLDTVSWASATTGASTLRADQDDFCTSTSPYGEGGDLGTPGLPNDACL